MINLVISAIQHISSTTTFSLARPFPILAWVGIQRSMYEILKNKIKIEHTLCYSHNPEYTMLHAPFLRDSNLNLE